MFGKIDLFKIVDGLLDAIPLRSGSVGVDRRLSDIQCVCDALFILP
jgi:hypothetical protein